MKPVQRANRTLAVLRDPQGATYAKKLVSATLLRRLGASAASPRAWEMLREGNVITTSRRPSPAPARKSDFVLTEERARRLQKEHSPWNIPTTNIPRKVRNALLNEQLLHLDGLQSVIAREKARIKAVLKKATEKGNPDSR